jgi:hypothetical protein
VKKKLPASSSQLPAIFKIQLEALGAGNGKREAGSWKLKTGS